MVAKTPLKERRMAMALNPKIVREAVKKVDRCMARLQELQFTVTGGTKEVSGVRLSPRSTRGYLKTSLRCKQENLRNNAAGRKSPPGKFQGSANSTGEWQRMSLPAMLLGETVVEILQASQFAKDIVAAAATKRPKPANDPKTPDATARRCIAKKVHCKSTELRARRMNEKNCARHANSPPLPRARSRIAFKSNSPLRTDSSSSNNNKVSAMRVVANHVSPKNRPWAKKTVLFPNPLFLSSSPTSTRPKFYKTRSPILGRTTQPKTKPHKFLVKSPSTSLKSQFKSKKAVPAPIVKSHRRCSFSPSKLASRLVSPLKSRIPLQTGLKQRPKFSTPAKKNKTSF